MPRRTVARRGADPTGQGTASRDGAAPSAGASDVRAVFLGSAAPIPGTPPLSFPGGARGDVGARACAPGPSSSQDVAGAQRVGRPRDAGLVEHAWRASASRSRRDTAALVPSLFPPRKDVPAFGATLAQTGALRPLLVSILLHSTQVRPWNVSSGNKCRVFPAKCQYDSM